MLFGSSALNVLIVIEQAGGSYGCCDHRRDAG